MAMNNSLAEVHFLKIHPVYEHWYPVFAVMIGTGLRVGEVTGLRWCDIDMESAMIDDNHTLVYYDHRTEGSKSGCYFNVNTTKTPASMRQVPMLGTKPHSTKQSEELSVIAIMSSFYTVMNLMCYFLILAATRLDIHLQQECVKLE